MRATLCRSDDLANAIALLQQAGQPAHVELLRAVRDGVLALAVIGGRDQPFPALAMMHPPRPILVLVGDDDGVATGPAGWRCAAELAAWAGAALIHGAGAEPGHYRMAIAAAVLGGRAALIETNSANLEAWSKRFAGTPSLIVKPRDDLPHPLPMRPEAMQ